MRIRRPHLFASVGITALALLAAGCGGGGSPTGVATLNTTTTAVAATPQSQQAQMVAFARCMRSNGVHGFPDPPSSSTGGHAFKGAIARLASSDPHFATAQHACAHLLPSTVLSGQSAQQQRTQLADGLSFARCMRRRGVANFPDPTAQGQLTVAMVAAQGINVNSPQVLRVVQACLPASHGGLTPAKVRKALNNFNHGRS